MSAEYPGALWVPSPNFFTGRAGQSVLAIVQHTTAGPWWGAVHNWLSQAASEVSYHFQVRKSGAVDQFVSTSNGAWGAGIKWSRGYDYYKSDRSIPWIDRCWKEQINPNYVVVHVAHEGQPHEPLTEQQYQASKALTRWLCGRHDVTPTGEFIVGHYKISGVQRANCPGPLFPWSRLLSDLNPVEVVHYEPLRDPLNELWRRAQVLQQIGTDTIRISREIEAYIIQTKKRAGFPD